MLLLLLVGDVPRRTARASYILAVDGWMGGLSSIVITAFSIPSHLFFSFLLQFLDLPTAGRPCNYYLSIWVYTSIGNGEPTE